MKLVSFKLSLAVASVALVLAGCTKKPTRPDPSVTAIGLTPGGSNIVASTPPSDASFNAGAPGLSLRPEGFDPSGQNRTALEAQTVYFDFDKSDIKPSEREKLRVAKDYLDTHPGHRLLLEGHCDWRGTAEYNLSLGDRRANATKRYLQSIGVAPERLEALSKGSLEASKNADAATMDKDRRVNLVVVDPAAASVAQTPL
ncbi:MAG: OmpA family protein [Opitutaceae bacterium]